MTTTTVTTYAVRAERSGKWWALSVPDLPGVHTQARTLTEARAMATEAIALIADVDEASIDVEIVPADDGIASMLADVQAKEAEAAELENAARASRRALVEAMQADGWTFRDIGTALGISHQRAAQLVA